MSDYVIIEIPNFITSSGTRITYGYEYVPEYDSRATNTNTNTNTQVNLDCIVINIDSSNKQNTNSTNGSTYSNGNGISKLNIYNLFPMLKPKFMSNYIIENGNIV
uniref:Uncharacterized protein n=1 Tax=viral metagenome TaxID=1070528 RepID=A0A6C0EXA2_9ZZZZ